MLLSALLLAAAVQAAPPPDRPPTQGGPLRVEAMKGRALRVMGAGEACGASGLQMAEQPGPALKPKVKRLGDLPPANHTLTVLRSVDGCPVSSTIRFNVDRPVGR
ncbi:hypothetical protein [Caulobacter sp. LARHSG274]